jgi:undecaprenyl-diphosphatase
MTTGDPLLDFAVSLRSPGATAVMVAVSAASSPEAFFLLLPCVYWVLSRRVGLLLFVADAAASLGAVMAKDIVAAPRPPDAGPTAWLARAETQYALPSGHATSTAAACSTPVALSPALRAAALAAAITATVGFSRMYLGLHYTVDVVAGAGLGAATAALFVWAAPRAGRALARAPLAARASSGLLFLLPLAINHTPPAVLIASAAAGALCGHALADARGWRLKTGHPATLPAWGLLRILIGLPVIIGIAVGLGDPTAGPVGPITARFLPLGLFVTLIGPRLFLAVERAAPWDEGFRRRPSH